MATFQNIMEISLRVPEGAEIGPQTLSDAELQRLNAAHRVAQAAEAVHFRNDVAALAGEISRCASTLEGALDQTTKEFCQRKGIVGAAVAILHRDRFRCWSRYGSAPDLGVAVGESSSAAKEAIESKAIVVVTDRQALRGYPDVRAVAMLPLLVRESVSGLLALFAEEEAALDAELLGHAIVIAKVIQMWMGDPAD